MINCNRCNKLFEFFLNSFRTRQKSHSQRACSRGYPSAPFNFGQGQLRITHRRRFEPIHIGLLQKLTQCFCHIQVCRNSLRLYFNVTVSWKADIPSEDVATDGAWLADGLRLQRYRAYAAEIGPIPNTACSRLGCCLVLPAPNVCGVEVTKWWDKFDRWCERRGRGSLRPRRARSPFQLHCWL